MNAGSIDETSLVDTARDSRQAVAVPLLQFPTPHGLFAGFARTTFSVAGTIQARRDIIRAARNDAKQELDNISVKVEKEQVRAARTSQITVCRDTYEIVWPW